MKKTLLTLAVLAAASVVSAQGWQKPVYEGAFQPLTDGEIVYVYNVEAKQFLTEGNDWGTHASVGDTGLQCKVECLVKPTDEASTRSEIGEPPAGEEDNVFTIWVNSVAKDGWHELFITDGGNIYVDRGSQEDFSFGFKALGNNTYNIYGAFLNPVYNHTGDYANHLVGHYTLYRDAKNDAETGTGVVYGDTGVDSEFEPGTFNTTWAFVSLDDYDAYLGKIKVYEEAMELAELIAKAKEMGVDASAAEAVYANTSATMGELTDATNALFDAIMKQYEQNTTPDNPMDMTRLIENVTCDNTSGWNNGIGATTWETANMSAGWQTEWEEGAFTDSYLNIWGASLNGSVWQELTGIPNGIYVFSVSSLAEKDGAFVYAGMNYKAIPADSKGRSYSITTNVTDGKLEFGIAQMQEGTNWLCMDNASLLYYGSGLDAYKHWLSGLKETTPDLSDAYVQKALIDEYNAIVAKVDAADTEEAILAIVKEYEDIINRININIEAYDNLLTLTLNIDNTINEANAYYAEKISDYCLEVATPAVEAYELSTDEINAIAAELRAMLEEAQQYIWNVEKLTTEVNVMAGVYEECKESCTAEAETAYNAFCEKYAALDFSNLTAAAVEALIQQIYDIEFDLQKPADPASDDNPVDYTAKIYNPSFIVGAEGWTNEGWGTFGNNKDNWAPATNEEGAISDDQLYLNLWNAGNANAWQDIAQLPAGAYTLTFGAYADAEGLQIGVNGNTVDIPAGQTPEGLYLRLYSIDFIVTKDMSCGAHITISNVGGGTVWGMVDEFRLAYKGTDSQILTGIEAAESNAATAAPTGIYTVSGTRANALQRGINIVRHADGTMHKIMVK